jgi:hypothetical protein
MDKFKIKAKVWLYPGKAAWHFVTIPPKQAKEIKKLFGKYHRGWGSLPVSILVKPEITWETSIFWDKKNESYLLPIKAVIRKKAGIAAGNNVELELQIKPWRSE